MRRRELLAAAGTFGTAALAGCGALTGRSSRIAGEPCPPIGGDDRTCYHTGDGDLVLEPDDEHLAEPGPNRFTLHNRTGSGVSLLLPSEVLARRIDGNWQQVPAQRQDNLETAQVSTGGSLRVGLAHGTWRELGDVEYTLRGAPFGAGAFLFGLRVADQSFETTTALARFDVDGDPLAVGPPNRPTIDREGDTALVYPDDETGPVPDSTATFVAAPDAQNPRRIASEVLASRVDIQAATWLREDAIDRVVVGIVNGYFRTPIEWLQAANVWDGSERSYAIDGATFRVREGRVE